MTIRRWREEGQKIGNAYASPTTEYKITAVYLKAEASYMKWLVKTGADDKPLAEPPASQSVQRRSTSSTRLRSVKLPFDYGEISPTRTYTDTRRRKRVDADRQSVAVAHSCVVIRSIPWSNFRAKTPTHLGRSDGQPSAQTTEDVHTQHSGSKICGYGTVDGA